MPHTLEIKAFFFNAKTDYLPYYKNFKIVMQDDETAKNLLSKIHDINEKFSYPKQKLFMKINHLIVEEDENISNIVKRLGTTLQIDPVNSYRSNNGLIINDDDFMQSYKLLAPFTTDADLEYYKTLYALHYASETEDFDHEYIGDAILLLAHKIITDGSEHKQAILNAITSVSSGLLDCEYENNLFNGQNHTKTIETLKKMTKEIPNESPTLMERIIARFNNNKKKTTETTRKNNKKSDNSIENLSNKHIAYYAGDSTRNISELIQDIDAKEIHFSRTHKLSGLSLLKDNKTLALKKAGTTLLDAFDSGAEVFVVEDEAIYKMFTENFISIEKIMGRKLIGLDILTAKDFKTQVSSITAIESHKID